MSRKANAAALMVEAMPDVVGPSIAFPFRETCVMKAHSGPLNTVRFNSCVIPPFRIQFRVLIIKYSIRKILLFSAAHSNLSPPRNSAGYALPLRGKGQDHQPLEPAQGGEQPRAVVQGRAWLRNPSSCNVRLFLPTFSFCSNVGINAYFHFFLLSFRCQRE